MENKLTQYRFTAEVKKVLSLFLSFVMLISITAGLDLSAYARYSNNELYGYEVLDDGTIEIYGYHGNDANLVIPSTIDGYKVTSIGDTAFILNESITSITVPESVTNINGAFACCENLKSVTLPNSITEIGMHTFFECKKLTDITIPNSVTSIGYGAFARCKKLPTITIPASVTRMESGVFDHCKSLKSINVDSNNKNYSSENGILYNKNKTELIKYPAGKPDDSYTISNTVTKIDHNAFYACENLKNITVPNSVKSFDYAFLYCKSLTSAILQNGITNISEGAFSGCISLTNITIPNSVTHIGNRAFNECTGLTVITIPNRVTNIDILAFAECTGLKNIKIPANVTNLANSALDKCTGLTNITVDANNKNYSSANGVLYNKKKTEIVRYPIAKSASSFKLPGSVKKIGDFAFEDCIKLTGITIPKSVISIGKYAFNNCIGFKSIALPNSVKTIDYGAFAKCSELTSIILPTGLSNIESSTFSGCKSLKSITIPNGVKNLGDFAFQNCKALTGIIIPNGVKTIGYYAFENCKKAKKIKIPNSVTSIGYKAFVNTSYYNNKSNWTNGALYIDNCLIDTNYDTMPAAFSIKNKVITIADEAVRGRAITSLVIPDSVKYIGNNAFDGCYKLKNISIPDSVTKIGKEAFADCENLKSIAIPNRKVKIGKHAFAFRLNGEDIINYYLYDSVKIYGHKGSTAETYAKKNGIDFGTAKNASNYKVTLSKTSYKYNGKAKKPAVTVKNSKGNKIDPSNYIVTYSSNKNVGKATVTVSFTGKYTGTIKKTFTIKENISEIKSQYKGFTVKWGKAPKAKGYQIQYSTSSKFTNAKTVTVNKNSTVSKTIKGLTANKKYYVRVRTYTAKNGKKTYSAWTSSKCVKASSHPTDITLSSSGYIYDGKAKKPAVTVKNKGKKSVQNIIL